MISQPEVLVVCPQNRQQWREWLQAHHHQQQSVWLMYHKKTAATPTLTWSEAVDEALCFGWLDSTAKPLDAEKYQQFFSRRKPKSGWSKVNKAKVQRLIAEEKMMPAGLATIETAQQNGSWTLLDDVEELRLPADLEQAIICASVVAIWTEDILEGEVSENEARGDAAPVPGVQMIHGQKHLGHVGHPQRTAAS
jgi:uncharacterized protein YdeI (YjbR/CyaY-like superfamily)